jgi:WD40 repeat protein
LLPERPSVDASKKSDPEKEVTTLPKPPENGTKDEVRVKEATVAEPFKGEIAIGKPAVSREAELQPVAGRALVAYLRPPWEDEQEVESIAFSPDGTLLAAGRKAGVALWEVATGKRRAVLPVSQEGLRVSGVRSIAFSSDGATLVAADNCTVYLWNVKDGRQQRVLTDPAKDSTTSFVRLQLAGDGSALATLNSKGEVRIWNTGSGETVTVVPETAMIVEFEESDLRVSPDGTSVVFTAKPDKKLVQIEIASGKVLQRWEAHPPGGKSVFGFTANGKGLVTTNSKDGRLMLWDLTAPGNGRELAVLDGPSEFLAVTPGGSLAAVANREGGVSFYDLASGSLRGRSVSAGSLQDPLRGLAFSPTGKIMAARAKNRVLVWDVEQNVNERLIALDEPGESLAGASSGQVALLLNEKLHVYDPATGAVKHTVPWSGGLFGLALDATGTRLAAGGETVRVMDLAKATKRESFPAREGTVLAFSPDGQYLAGSDHALIHLEVKEQDSVLSGHRFKVRALMFSPDSKRLVSGAEDGKVIVWDVAGKKPQWEFDAHEQSVEHLALSADGKWLASAGGKEDPTLRIWDLSAGKEKTTLQASYGGPESINGILLSPDGEHVLVAHNSGDLDLWDTATGKRSRRIAGHDDTVRALTALGPGKLATSDNRRVLIWSWDKLVTIPPTYAPPAEVVAAVPPGFATLLRKFEVSEPVRRLRYSADGSFLALLTDKECQVRKGLSGEELPWKAEHAGLADAVISLDGKSLFTCGDDKSIKVWDMAKGEVAQTLTGHSAGVNAMAVALGGKALVSGSGAVAGDFELIFWDLPEGKLRKKTKEQTANIIALAAAGDGKTVASGSTNGKVYLWDPAAGKLLKTLDVAVNSKPLVISANGKRLACDDANNIDKCNLWVWDLPTGKLVNKLPHSCGTIYESIGFTADGTTLLAHARPMVQVWDVAAGKQRALLHSARRVDTMAISPDGRVLATFSSADKAVSFWKTDDLLDAKLQQSIAGFLSLGGEANLIGGMLHLTLSVKGRKTAAALDLIAKLPYPVALKLTASERLNDRDLGRLKGATNLRRLELEGATFLADEGLQQIATLTSLEGLTLNSPRINDKGLERLRGLKGLRSLHLGDTDVTRPAIESLQRALPKLDVTQ